MHFPPHFQNECTLAATKLGRLRTHPAVLLLKSLLLLFELIDAIGARESRAGESRGRDFLVGSSFWRCIDRGCGLA